MKKLISLMAALLMGLTLSFAGGNHDDDDDDDDYKCGDCVKQMVVKVKVKKFIECQLDQSQALYLYDGIADYTSPQSKNISGAVAHNVGEGVTLSAVMLQEPANGVYGPIAASNFTASGGTSDLTVPTALSNAAALDIESFSPGISAWNHDLSLSLNISQPAGLYSGGLIQYRVTAN